ncbi:MAG: hypothetical protein U0Z53_23250 [Blastocatellia bacterium]
MKTYPGRTVLIYLILAVPLLTALLACAAMLSRPVLLAVGLLNFALIEFSLWQCRRTQAHDRDLIIRLCLKALGLRLKDAPLRLAGEKQPTTNC